MFSEGEDTKSKEADCSKSAVSMIMNRKLSGQKKVCSKMYRLFRRLTFLFKIAFIYTLTYVILRFSEEQNFGFLFPLNQNHQKYKK